MKKLLLSAVSITALTLTTAYAENTLAGKYYAGFSAFWSEIPDSDAVYNGDGTPGGSNRVKNDAQWDGAFGLNAFVGYKLWQGNHMRTRIEGEVGYRNLDLDEKSLDNADVDSAGTWSFMGNGYLDIPLQFGLTPYIGLGAGMSLVDIGGEKGHDTVFTWQAIAGTSYSVTDFAEVFAEYRYVALDDIEFSAQERSGNFLEYASHNIGLGLRIHF